MNGRGNRGIRIAFALDALTTTQPTTRAEAEAILQEFGLTHDDILISDPCECGGSPDGSNCNPEPEQEWVHPRRRADRRGGVRPAG